ncbi:MAG: hypothetical protein ACYCO3_00760 [Mycobacteriales bacterium]
MTSSCAGGDGLVGAAGEFVADRAAHRERAGASLRELMVRMGHSSLKAALHYQHATRDRDAAIARALSDLVEQSQRANPEAAEPADDRRHRKTPPLVDETWTVGLRRVPSAEAAPVRPGQAAIRRPCAARADQMADRSDRLGRNPYARAFLYLAHEPGLAG